MKPRMPGEERKRSIIRAAREAFAEGGFSATSVKDIAEAADVSEALIYKHFPSKEALYAEVLEYGHEMVRISRRELEALGPGTEALVLYTYYLLHVIVFDVPGRVADQRTFEKLLYRSLIGDPKFAQRHFQTLRSYLADDFIDACFQAAAHCGDLAEIPIGFGNRMWFVHHLGMALSLCHVSGTSTFEYRTPKWQLVEHAVLFCLRGMGLTDEAIRKHFQPEKLRAFMKRVHG